MNSDDPRSSQVSRFWASDFGNEYTARNAATEYAVHTRVRGLAAIWDSMRGDLPASVLECGCNVGLNLRALRRFTGADLYAVEPNAKARSVVVADSVLPPERIHNATVERLPFPDGAMDLVFTAGVLIHVPPEHLSRACREVHRVAHKYVMALEYFSKEPETIAYRGHDNLLFKRDFGGFYLDHFSDLIPVAEGFLWQRTTGYDDVTWWLFRKRGA
jgi:pseudaminic acid biosynthesis-associated methylase